MLQRDYVQGGNAEVIRNILDAQLEGDADLNYIYGYDEAEGFVAVDGQQRLITLWLFHLYLYARKGKLADFRVPLRFSSREAANDFCSRLSEKICEALAALDADDKRTEEERLYAGQLRNAIIDQNWFIPSWLQSATVGNMLLTLNHLHCKVSQRSAAELGNITFSFLNMGGEDKLDDDIYVKMNGRGRPLSRFENFKAFMDKRVAALELSYEWRSCMDNEWADLLWNNLESKGELDREFMACFCNLLALYHIKHLAQLEATLDALDKYKREELFALLGCNDKKPLNAERIVDTFRNGNLLPLSWIETLALVPDDFFAQAFEWMNRLCLISDSDFMIDHGGDKSLNDLDLFIANDSKKSTTYLLAMTLGSYANTLPKLYAALTYSPEPSYLTTFEDWMCITRNLIENTNIDFKRLPKVLDDIDNLYSIAANSYIYQYLSTADATALPHFDKMQVKEEIEKARFVIATTGSFTLGMVPMDYRCELHIMEAYGFFRGSLRFLLRNAAGEYCCNEDEFVKKFTIASRYFCKDGVKEKYATDALLLRRLISHFNVERGVHIDFDCYKMKYDRKLASSWREILLAEHLCAPVHKLLMNNDVETYDYAAYTLTDDEEHFDRDRYAREVLVRTPLLTAVVENCEMRWRGDLCGGSFVLYPAGARASWKFYILTPRIELLMADPERITFYDKNQENCRSCRLVFGKWNWFWYAGELFCWDTYRYNNVLLGDKKSATLAIRRPDAEKEEERFYCTHISTANITANGATEQQLNDFYAALDSLIASYQQSQ